MLLNGVISVSIMLSLQAIEHNHWHDGQLRLAAVDDNRDTDDSVVGCIDLYNFDPIHRRAAVGITVRTDLRRCHVGSQMLHLLSVMAYDVLNIHQLYADIRITNQPSINLFTKAGYLRCGLFKSWLVVADGFEDVVRMQLILGDDKIINPLT